MVVPSPSPPPGKSDLRAEGLRLRRDFARSLTPALRAELESGAGAARPAASGRRADRRRLSSAPRRDRPGRDPGRAWATASASACPGSPIATPRFLWREGPALEPEPVGRRSSRRPRPRRWRPTSCSCPSSSPTGTAPGSATARAITTARSPICAKAAARSSPSASPGRASSSTRRSRPIPGT